MDNNKVLLVTLQGANIGNRLQNYALQTILEEKGYDVFTPYYDAPEINTLKKKIKETIKIILGWLGVAKYRFNSLRYTRARRFRQFDKKYISNYFHISFDNINKININCFNIAICGSDQVWHNWSEDKNELDYFYLQFMPYEKRISYAPSFGFEMFPEKDKKIHINGIKGMAYLSIREKTGQKLIKEAGRESTLVLDPTLLLSADKWQKISARPDYNVPERFVLVYFLGTKTSEYISIINKTAEDNKAAIIDVFDLNIKKYYYTTPDEFVWLVEHACAVITDSFHACVFSIIFHKKFMHLGRQQIGFNNMHDRIETLLSICGIGNECCYDGSTVWENVDASLNEKREESLDYLVSAINSVLKNDEIS